MLQVCTLMVVRGAVVMRVGEQHILQVICEQRKSHTSEALDAVPVEQHLMSASCINPAGS